MRKLFYFYIDMLYTHIINIFVIMANIILYPIISVAIILNSQNTFLDIFFEEKHSQYSRVHISRIAFMSRLYVGNLNPGITKEKLGDAFNRFGPIVEIWYNPG